MKLFKFWCLIVGFCFLALTSFAQQKDSVAIKDVLKFQEELNHEYRSSEKSPLPEAALANFKGHDFFPIDLAWRVDAKLVRYKKGEPFKMTTTKGVVRDYIKFGELHFTLAGKPQKLVVYQSVALTKKEEYKDHLFLPFTDLTNGEESYGGGRYIDLKIPKGKRLVVDFNKAYNPYCAYTDKYSCPIPPAENHLDLKIKAGIKKSHLK